MALPGSAAGQFVQRGTVHPERTEDPMALRRALHGIRPMSVAIEQHVGGPHHGGHGFGMVMFASFPCRGGSPSAYAPAGSASPRLDGRAKLHSS